MRKLRRPTQPSKEKATEFKIKNYTVKRNGEYLYIKVKGYSHYYQLKLEDEGLVLDLVSSNDKGILSDLFHCVNDEVLICDYCGKPDCDYDCDESQAEFNDSE